MRVARGRGLKIFFIFPLYILIKNMIKYLLLTTQEGCFMMIHSSGFDYRSLTVFYDSILVGSTIVSGAVIVQLCFTMIQF